MDIDVRLNILLENDVITEEVYNRLKEVINRLKDEFNIEITEENGGMFITHLSAAITRVNDGKPLDSIDESVIEQIKLETSYNRALEIMETINNIFGVIFPKEEEVFIITHLCTILS